jgi:tetratricopeptide (TPR) repeat protein
VLIRALAGSGHIPPSSRDGTTGYTFQDLQVLRIAGALKAAKIPSAKITAAMNKMRAAMPAGSLLSSPALAASGKDLAIREGAREWEANSGQYALPLAAAAGPSRVVALPMVPTSRSTGIAARHYERAHALEDSDVSAARGAYLDALQADGDHLDARINLGRLLHLEGSLKEAETVYRQAQNSSALLSFNLAILLEDLNREDDAVDAYRDALAQDPGMHDAHFNLSRLYEKRSKPQDALRHLLAYRRHILQHGE